MVATPGGAIDDGVDYSYPPTVPAALFEPGMEAKRDEYLQALALKETTPAYQSPFDTPYNNTGENLLSFPFTIPLREWDWGTRRRIIERTHLAYERNPLAKRAVKINTQFSIGEGLTITYRAPEVEEVLEAFRANVENSIESYEKEFQNDLQLDGELIIRFFKNADGDTIIVPLRPWEIAWIECDPQFIKRVVSYHRQGYLSNGVPGNYQAVIDDISADDVLHVAINKNSYEQRGRPELFVILPWLRAYKDWVEDRARQNKHRGAVMLDITLTNGTPIQVATKRAQYKQPPPPGSVYIHNDKEAMEYKESKVNAADVAEDGRQIKLMSAVGMGQPEYMLSDGQNANLASASAQQLPALKTFGEFQDIAVEQVWRPIYRRVIENAIAAGTLPAEVFERDTDGKPVTEVDGKTEKKIKTVDAFDVAAPELESDDPFNLAQALQIQEANGWISKETASSKAGNDYRVEKRKIDAEQEAEIAARAQGKALGPLPDMMQPLPPEMGGTGTIEPKPNVKGVQIAAPAPAGGKPGFPESEQLAPVLSSREVEPIIINMPGTNVPVEFAATLGSEFAKANERTRLEMAEMANTALSATHALAGKVDGLGADVARLSEASAKRENDVMQAFNALMTQMEAANEAPPPTITIDEDLIRRIAGETAQAVAVSVVEATQTIGNEVTSRDSQGRALEVRRVLANGQSVNYHVKRDDLGNFMAFERM